MIDKRYGTRHWKRVRLEVLRRDRHRCWVSGCGECALVCDHVEPLTPDMPDWLFYSRDNLRASCQRHNLFRGHAAALERELAGEPEAPRQPTGPGGTIFFSPRKPRIG